MKSRKFLKTIFRLGNAQPGRILKKISEFRIVGAPHKRLSSFSSFSFSLLKSKENLEEELAQLQASLKILRKQNKFEECVEVKKKIISVQQQLRGSESYPGDVNDYIVLANLNTEIAHDEEAVAFYKKASLLNVFTNMN